MSKIEIVSDKHCPDFEPLPGTFMRFIFRIIGKKHFPSRVIYMIGNTIICSPGTAEILIKSYHSKPERSEE